MSTSAKAFAVVLLGVIGTIVQLVVTNNFNTSEWQTVIATIVTAATVWLVPNTPKGV